MHGTAAPASTDTAPRLADTAILVVAEHALVRAGLRAVIGATPGLAVVADVADLEAAAPVAAAHRPDVVLLEAPPTSDADPAITALCGAAPGACIVCLADPERRDSARLPCVPCEGGVSELCSVLGGLLGERCAACVLRGRCPAARSAVALSRREKQVAVLVAAGLASKQIAARLGIGLRTVNTYRESLSRKLGASSPAVLTRYVLEHGLEGELEHGLQAALG